jgi:ribonuclease BN (tRNA processing enzyme)
MSPADRSFQLDVVGAGPAYTDRAGATGAAYLIRAGATSLVLDLGQGVFPRLAGLLEPSTLNAVVVSHLHPDHFIDLVALRHYLHWEFTPGRHARVIAPRGLGDRLDALHDHVGFTAASLDVEVLSDGMSTIGDLTVEARRIWHTDDSYGIRVSAGLGAGVGADALVARPGLVYSGDCGRAEDLEPLIRPGDTLLTEVSYGPGPVPTDAPHLDGPAVANLARHAAVGRVLLTHLQMGYDVGATIASVRAGYEGPVAMVQPGDRFTIGG